MWKVLIKLVESFSYRCPHKWELLEKHKIKFSNNILWIYRCEKCCKAKKISTEKNY